MKTKLLSLIFGVAVASIAHSEVLYWTVSDYTHGTSYSDWTKAQIYVDGNPATLLDTYGATDGYVSKLAQEGVYASYIDSSTYNSASSFYIELYNDSSKVAWSELVSRDALSAFVTQGASLATPPSGSGYGFTAVPEPTSGLMMLLGMAMLGLRRRKVA